MKHTSGPWNVDESYGAIGTIIADDGTVVAQAQQCRPMPDDLFQIERKANAILIAAAPELLDALIKLRGAIDGIGLDYPYLTECKVLAIAAIAKAEGE